MLLLTRICRALIAVAALLIGSAESALAAQQPDPTGGLFELASDWAFTMNVQMHTNYLNYPGSSLRGLTDVKVYYLPKTPTAVFSDPGQHYEDFWFHTGKVLGSRRFTAIKIMPGSMGLIVVQPSDGSSADTRATADAIMRVLVEVAASRGSIMEVIVPLSIYPQLASELNQFRFYPTRFLKGNVPSHLLHLVSFPQGQDQYFYFANGASPV